MKELSLVELETLQGQGGVDCFIASMSVIGALGCAASAATPISWWYAAVCISAGAGAGAAVGEFCFG